MCRVSNQRRARPWRHWKIAGYRNELSVGRLGGQFVAIASKTAEEQWRLPPWWRPNQIVCMYAIEGCGFDLSDSGRSGLNYNLLREPTLALEAIDAILLPGILGGAVDGLRRAPPHLAPWKHATPAVLQRFGDPWTRM